MGLKETCNQLYGLAVNGRINGEHFTKTRFYNYVRGYMDKGFNEVFLMVDLPDGRWFARVERFAPGQYDYDLPATRKEETYLIGKITEMWRKLNEN